MTRCRSPRPRPPARARRVLAPPGSSGRGRAARAGGARRAHRAAEVANIGTCRSGSSGRPQHGCHPGGRSHCSRMKDLNNPPSPPPLRTATHSATSQPGRVAPRSARRALPPPPAPGRPSRSRPRAAALAPGRGLRCRPSRPHRPYQPGRQCQASLSSRDVTSLATPFSNLQDWGWGVTRSSFLLFYGLYSAAVPAVLVRGPHLPCPHPRSARGCSRSPHDPTARSTRPALQVTALK